MKTLKILLVATFMFGIAPFVTPVINIGSVEAAVAVGDCGSIRKIRGKIEDELKSKPILGGVEADGAFRLIHVSRDKSRYVMTVNKDGEMCVVAKGTLNFINKRVMKRLLGN